MFSRITDKKSISLILLFLPFLNIYAESIITPSTVSGTRFYTIQGEGGVRAVYILEDMDDAQLTTSVNAYWYDALNIGEPLGGGQRHTLPRPTTALTR